MENGRQYRSNPALIGLLVIGTLAIIIEVLSYILALNILIYEINGMNVRILRLLFVIVILLSAQFAYLDASKIEAGKAYPHQKTFRSLTWTPASWAALCFFLWIFIFPYYLYKREDIFWQNIDVEYSTLKTIERDIASYSPAVQMQQTQPDVSKKEYGDNVGVCPNCDTPYPLRMLERSKYCNRCGGLLKKSSHKKRK